MSVAHKREAIIQKLYTTRHLISFLTITSLLTLAACSKPPQYSASNPEQAKQNFTALTWTLTLTQQKILDGATAQLQNPAVYDASYQKIPYPNGDVPKDRGACTDVVIRALRNAGHDLQKLIHEDAKKSFYPRISDPDPNIDQRRCPNLIVFFQNHGQKLSIQVKSAQKDDWQPGDIVFWKLPDGRDHTGVLANTAGPSGNLTVIHNASTLKQQDCLATWEIVGHYRYPKN